VNAVEWSTCRDANLLLEYAAGRAGDRSWRLFACARCRRVWDQLTDRRCRDAVEAAELFADGQLSAAELADFRAAAEAVADAAGAAADERWSDWCRAAGTHWGRRPADWPSHPQAEEDFRAAENAWAVAWATTWAAQAPPATWWGPNLSQVFRGFPSRRVPVSFYQQRQRPPFVDEPPAMARDVFDGLFAEVRIEPAWRCWNNGLIPRLAQAACDHRQLPAGLLDNSRLAVLSDALEEAGCTNPLILRHLRLGGEHVRGCFVVEALLGRTEA
jgi:hypothetical protein